MPVTTLDPKTALIVVDLQKGMLSYPLKPHSVSEVVGRANDLIGAFRKAALPVVLVVVEDIAPGRTDQPRHQAPRAADFAELIEDLDTKPDDLRIVKRNPGSFARTGLKQKLDDLGVTQVVVVGIATGSGVESTARQAYELGFNVTLPIDAMTDANVENHEGAIAKVFPRIAETGSTQDVIRTLEQRR